MLLTPAAASAEPPLANFTLSDELVRVGERVTMVDRSVDLDGEIVLRERASTVTGSSTAGT